MFDLNHRTKAIYNTIFFIVSFISFTILTACSGSSSSDNIDGLLAEDEADISVLLTGRVIKGVIENANVTTYNVVDGKISQPPIKSSMTDLNGSYEIKTPRKQLLNVENSSSIVYLEASASSNPRRPTLMTCDSINGCGVKNNTTINFGDTFPVSKDFKLRGYVIIDPNNNKTSAQLTPWSHMAVAYAESLPGGLSVSNIDEANATISKIFSFSQPVNTLTAIDLTSNSEMDSASDAELVATIIASSLLNMGQSPDYLDIETVLLTLTKQGGLFLANDTQDLASLSLHNISRQSLSNIPTYISDRASIENQLTDVYEKAVNAISDIEINVVSGLNGTIISTSHNFECSGTCQYNIAKNETITLNATADNDFEFTSWNGSCPGLVDQSHPVCEFNVTEVSNIQAEFSPLSTPTHNLIISIEGSGLVNLDNENLNCSNNCIFTLNANTLVNLSALSSSGYHIESWSLDNSSVCGSSINCEALMNGDHNLHIVFKEDTPPAIEFVSLSVKANGPGVITDSGLNLQCQETDCTFQIAKGSTVNFTALPLDSKKYEFTSWQGLCSGAGNCIRTLESDASLTAIFNALPQQTMTINVSEGGSVVESILNTTCTQGSTCNNYYDIDTQVNLKALANSGYVFDHWENACTGIADNCSVLMDSEKTVNAVFSAIPKQTLTIVVSQGGSVVESALNITCTAGNTCSTDLDFNTQTNLQAQANAGYIFDHWENECTNLDGNCSLTIKSDHTVKAVFTALTTSTSVSWTPPTQRESGADLNQSEIKKYIIYYGVQSGVYTDAIEVGIPADSNILPTELVLEGLETGIVYYIAGMTVDTDNTSSTLSNEISRLIE